MKYTKLIEKVKEQHLTSVEFSKETIKIKKQIGNKDGCLLEIEFSDSKRIHSIKFVAGGYNEPRTVKDNLDDLFDLIINAYQGVKQ